MKLNVLKQAIIKGERIIKLTRIEFQILLLLALNLNKIFSREEIFKKLDKSLNTSLRTLDTHVCRLNERLVFLNFRVYSKYKIGYFLKDSIEIILDE